MATTPTCDVYGCREPAVPIRHADYCSAHEEILALFRWRLDCDDPGYDITNYSFDTLGFGALRGIWERSLILHGTCGDFSTR